MYCLIHSDHSFCFSPPKNSNISNAWYSHMLAEPPQHLPIRTNTFRCWNNQRGTFEKSNIQPLGTVMLHTFRSFRHNHKIIALVIFNNVVVEFVGRASDNCQCNSSQCQMSAYLAVLLSLSLSLTRSGFWAVNFCLISFNKMKCTLCLQLQYTCLWVLLFPTSLV